jgi:hypothetical protein
MEVAQNYLVSKVEDTEIKFDAVENAGYNELVKAFAESQKGKGQSIDNYEANRKAARAYENNLLGKKGEFFAKRAMMDLGFPNISIDLEIREGKSKGWLPDLPYSSKYDSIPDVHVKTCDDFTVDFAGKSWTFQLKNASGYGGTDPILEKGTETDLVAFVYLSKWDSDTAIVHAIIPWGAVKKYPLLQLPVKTSLKDLKRCVYLADLNTYKKYIEKWKP